MKEHLKKCPKYIEDWVGGNSALNKKIIGVVDYYFLEKRQDSDSPAEKPFIILPRSVCCSAT
jgi:hypothetical protein